MTDAELRLWYILRESFPDARFRSQVPIGRFVADFCSHRAKLILEVDGGQHSAQWDARRTEWLTAEGYRVLRFWNHDVLSNGAGVAALIADALDDLHPSPTPPPQGEGNQKDHAPCHA